jgi:putative transposase
MSKYSEAQKIAALQQLDAGRKSEEIGRELGACKDTVYAWKQKYGGRSEDSRSEFEVTMARR